MTCTKLIEVDRLGSGVRVTGSYCCLLGVLNLISARFQIFSLTAEDVLGTEGNCPGEISGRNIRGNVLRSARGTRLDISTPFLADDVPDINTQWRIKMNIKVWRRFRTQTENQKITGTRLPQISLPVGGRNPHRPPTRHPMALACPVDPCIFTLDCVDVTVSGRQYPGHHHNTVAAQQKAAGLPRYLTHFFDLKTQRRRRCPRAPSLRLPLLRKVFLHSTLSSARRDA